LNLAIDAAGNFMVSLFADGAASPLYNLDGQAAPPGTTFSGVVPLVLQPGAYQLFLLDSHFQSTAGIIRSGFLDVHAEVSSVSAVPIPAAVWLLLSGIAALGASRRRGSPEE